MHEEIARNTGRVAFDGVDWVYPDGTRRPSGARLVGWCTGVLPEALDEEHRRALGDHLVRAIGAPSATVTVD